MDDTLLYGRGGDTQQGIFKGAIFLEDGIHVTGTLVLAKTLALESLHIWSPEKYNGELSKRSKDLSLRFWSFESQRE